MKTAQKLTEPQPQHVPTSVTQQIPTVSPETHSPSPPEHIIFILTKELQQALLDNSLVDIEALINQYIEALLNPSQDYFKTLNLTAKN